MAKEIAEGSFKIMFKHRVIVSYHKIRLLKEKPDACFKIKLVIPKK